jgi:MoaA/NifB/PqqE/SkfB family radical SAM enzyme
MLRVQNKWPHYYDSCKIEWNLGKRCNLDCSYCPAEIHDNNSPHTNIQTLFDTVDKIAEIPNARISFTGGEPCVHPMFSELIEYARNKISWLSVTTNCTRTVDFYASLLVNYTVFSLHFEDPKWQERLQTLIDFATITPRRRSDFHIALMAHHDYINEVKHAADILTHHHVAYTVRRIRWTKQHDWFDDMRYNGDDLQWILNNTATAEPNTLIDEIEAVHANDLIKENRNQFEGWTCRAGIESLMINWDGEVHRATCRVGGSLGNIYNGTFSVPTDPVTCTRKYCTCAADVNITKWKP